MEINQLYLLYLKHPSVETDSRKIKQGDIFFALKGPNFNGNDYAQKALDEGAVYSITDEPVSSTDTRIIQVKNCLECLQALAKKHREQFSIPFIAITGSNGKTTTKELIHAVLSTTYKTYTTEGNLNNHIGIPLTILKIRPDAEMAVVEMGANHQKEIESYCKYCLPTHGLITNCGKAHLEGFGGEAGVRKGKGELFYFLKQQHAAAFINTDYPYLLEMSEGIKTLYTYGTGDAMVSGNAVAENNNDFLTVEIKNGTAEGKIPTNLVGDYNLPNVLAAVAIGTVFNIPGKSIQSSLSSYLPSNSRSQLIEKNDNRIILDAYNANPSSMKVAIENFSHVTGDHKILILGGMMELGEESFAEHGLLVDLIKKFQWEEVILVGKDFKNLPKEFIHFNEVTEAAAWYRSKQFSNRQVLIKGSRSMQMEKVLE